MLLDAISLSPVPEAWRSYRDLQHELLVAIGGLDGVENWRECLSVELDCMR
jgi:hypothetical protein